MRYRVVKSALFPIFFTYLLLQCGTEARNYVILSTTKDGLRELRIAYRGRLVMETSLMNVQPESSVIYNRATDGIRLVETVVRRRLIEDCRKSSSYTDVLSFLSEFSRVKSKKMFDLEDEIMDVYLGHRNITDPVFINRHSLQENPVTYTNASTVMDTDSILTEDGMAKRKSLYKNLSKLKLSAEITSGKNSPFLQMFKRHFHIRRKARECKQFFKEARTRLQLLSDLMKKSETEGREFIANFVNDTSIASHTRHQYRQNHHHHHHHQHYGDRHRHKNQHSDRANRAGPDSVRTSAHRREHSVPPVFMVATTTATLPSGRKQRREEKEAQISTSTTTADISSIQQNTSGRINDQKQSDDSVKTPPSETSSSSSGISKRQRIIDSKIPENSYQLQNTEGQFMSSATYNSSFSASGYSNMDSEGYEVAHASTSSNISLEDDPPRPSSSKAHSRKKRDLLTGWMIFPGTKWCGDGDIAEHKRDMGYHVELDKCCRRHDLCPLVIPRLSWKYGMFNYRLHTLSHCRCDRKFRKCLKVSTSPLAHLIGKIYFNIVGPQCFKFTRKTVCVQRLWWGGCRKYDSSKVAYVKKQRRFK